ncbi:MAG: ATP-binding cassette domain-containing protein [Desulfobacterales bacterium]|nr:ATP-binding cassette domain-containing protein [Desulfobacterales bacterium]
MTDLLLEVEDLRMYFPVRGGVLRRRVAQVYAVDGVSFAIGAGRTLGLVGESGCGKTTVGRCVLRLYTPTGGRVHFQGVNLLQVRRDELRSARRDMQMIFQDPFESLNARHTVQEILEEPFIIHRLGDAAERGRRVRRLLEQVGLPRSALLRFPHEFSGGQRQRIGIARAVATEPRLIVCDEPVSALDVSIQSQILNLLLELQQQMGLSYLFIAHDLAVVKHISDDIAVMYLGRIVEYTDAETLYRTPRHPYTRALIAAIPVPDPGACRHGEVLTGDVPSPLNPPSGCHFRTRCPHAIERCRTEDPRLRPVPGRSGSGHVAACHRLEDLMPTD